MNEKVVLFGILVIFSSALLGSGWSHFSEIPKNAVWQSKNDPTKLNKTVPYCYHFTWMGSKFNKWTFKNIRNKTCAQYFKDKKTLCINPMVATYKGGKPDIGYILANHAEEATCRLSQEQVCVKYTVYYNGIISYETRYASVINVELEGPMEKGCIQERKGSQMVEVCACKSQPGPEGICNAASRISIGKVVMFGLISSAFIRLKAYSWCWFDLCKLFFYL